MRGGGAFRAGDRAGDRQGQADEGHEKRRIAQPQGLPSAEWQAELPRYFAPFVRGKRLQPVGFGQRRGVR